MTGTSRRPVPLEHCLYYGGEMFTISSREVYLPEGVRQASLAWKKKNEVPETKKDEKSQRPTGRGTPFAAGPNNAGGRGGPARGGGGGGGGAGRGRGGGVSDAVKRQVAGAMGGGGGGPNNRPGERGQLLELIGMLGKKQLLPVAFFCFSKKR